MIYDYGLDISNELHHGLIGMFYMNRNLINVSNPMYISENNTYCPYITGTETIDISNEMRWTNASKATFEKGNNNNGLKAIRESNIDNMLTAHFPNTIFNSSGTISMIVNKYLSDGLNTESDSGIILRNKNGNKLKVRADNNGINYVYLNSNDTAILQNTLIKNSPIEHMTLRIRYTKASYKNSTDTTEIMISDCTGDVVFGSFTVDGQFENSFSIYSHGNARITMLRVYQDFITDEKIQKLVRIGDGVSKIYLPNDFITYTIDRDINDYFKSVITVKRNQSYNHVLPLGTIFGITSSDSNRIEQSVLNTIYGLNVVDANYNLNLSNNKVLSYDISILAFPIDKTTLLYSTSSPVHSGVLDYREVNSTDIITKQIYSQWYVDNVMNGTYKYNCSIMSNGYSFFDKDKILTDNTCISFPIKDISTMIKLKNKTDLSDDEAKFSGMYTSEIIPAHTFVLKDASLGDLKCIHSNHYRRTSSQITSLNLKLIRWDSTGVYPQIRYKVFSWNNQTGLYSNTALINSLSSGVQKIEINITDQAYLAMTPQNKNQSFLLVVYESDTSDKILFIKQIDLQHTGYSNDFRNIQNSEYVTENDRIFDFNDTDNTGDTSVLFKGIRYFKGFQNQLLSRLNRTEDIFLNGNPVAYHMISVPQGNISRVSRTSLVPIIYKRNGVHIPSSHYYIDIGDYSSAEYIYSNLYKLEASLRTYNTNPIIISNYGEALIDSTLFGIDKKAVKQYDVSFSVNPSLVLENYKSIKIDVKLKMLKTTYSEPSVGEKFYPSSFHAIEFGAKGTNRIYYYLSPENTVKKVLASEGTLNITEITTINSANPSSLVSISVIYNPSFTNNTTYSFDFMIDGIGSPSTERDCKKQNSSIFHIWNTEAVYEIVVSKEFSHYQTLGSSAYGTCCPKIKGYEAGNIYVLESLYPSYKPTLSSNGAKTNIKVNFSSDVDINIFTSSAQGYGICKYIVKDTIGTYDVFLGKDDTRYSLAANYRIPLPVVSQSNNRLEVSDIYNRKFYDNDSSLVDTIVFGNPYTVENKKTIKKYYKIGMFTKLLEEYSFEINSGEEDSSNGLLYEIIRNNDYKYVRYSYNQPIGTESIYNATTSIVERKTTMDMSDGVIEQIAIYSRYDFNDETITRDDSEIKIQTTLHADSFNVYKVIRKSIISEAKVEDDYRNRVVLSNFKKTMVFMLDANLFQDIDATEFSYETFVSACQEDDLEMLVYGIDSYYNYTPIVRITIEKQIPIEKENFIIENGIVKLYTGNLTFHKVGGVEYIEPNTYKEIEYFCNKNVELRAYNYTDSVKKTWSCIVNGISNISNIQGTTDEQTFKVLQDLTGSNLYKITGGIYEKLQFDTFYNTKDFLTSVCLVIRKLNGTQSFGILYVPNIEQKLAERISSDSTYKIYKNQTLRGIKCPYVNSSSNLRAVNVAGNYSEILADNQFLIKSFIGSTEADNNMYITFKRNCDFITFDTSLWVLDNDGISVISSIKSKTYIGNSEKITSSNITYTVAPSTNGIILSDGLSILAYDRVLINDIKFNDTITINDTRYTSGLKGLFWKEYTFDYDFDISTSLSSFIKFCSEMPDSVHDDIKPDINGIYSEPYILTMNIQTIPYNDRVIKVCGDHIEYTGNSKSEISVYTPQLNGTTNPLIMSSDTGEKISISDIGDMTSNISIIEKLKNTIFGDNIVISNISIPYINMEALYPAIDSYTGLTHHYDFYGKFYKNYNKIDFSKTCSITNETNRQKYGVNASKIIIEDINIPTTREIQFAIKNDASSNIRDFSLLLTNDLNNNIQIGNDNLFTSQDNSSWQYYRIKVLKAISLIRFDIYKYNTSTDTYDVILKNQVYSDVLDFTNCKLSILSNGVRISDLKISSVEESFPELFFSRMEEESKTPITSKWYYENYDVGYDVKREDLYPKSQTVSNIDLPYYKEIIVEEESTKLRPFNNIFSIRSYQDQCRLIDDITKQSIRENIEDFDSDIYIQRLGTKYLNNMILLLDNNLNPTIESTYVKNICNYIGILVKDDNDSTMLIEDSFNELSYSYNYNKNLEESYTYSDDGLIIVGGAKVYLSKLNGTQTINNQKYIVAEVDVTKTAAELQCDIMIINGDIARSVYYIDSYSSYDFSNGVSDCDSDIYKPSRTSGELYITDDIKKFSKFSNTRYSIDKGCVVYLFEGTEYPILQATMFIDNIVIDPKEMQTTLQLKNKIDFLYDKKIVNYRTYENISVKECLEYILFPYIIFPKYDGNNNMISYSPYMIFNNEKTPSIKAIDLSSYETIGSAIDDICSCGFNIWFDERERLLIDNDIISKNMFVDNTSVICGNYENERQDTNIDIVNLNSLDDLTNDITISEKDSLTINSVQLDHMNLVPMYERDEYIVGDKIYPINNIGMATSTTISYDSNIIYEDIDGLIKSQLLTPYLTVDDFISCRLKTGVMCVVKSGDYEFQYKFIQAVKE